jgi:hypothetical protein
MRSDGMSDWERLADDKAIQTTMAALERHGIAAMVVPAGEDARHEALKLIPPGSDVLTNTSMTLDAIGLSAELNDSGRFV